MNITYIAVQYPLPTQTFAMSDIAKLTELGHVVHVECLLPATKSRRHLCELYGLNPKSIGNATVGGYVAGTLLAVRYVIENPTFFLSILWGMVSRPRTLLIFLGLLPRLCHVVFKLSRQRPDVVHAFWGHFPSVVPALLKRYAPGVRTSMHLGAYDLYAGFPSHLTAARVDACFTHSVSNLPRMREMGITRRIEMVHRGIPLEELSETAPIQASDRGRRYRFCTAASLVEDKQVSLSLRVFAHVRRSIPDAKLVVVGDGPELPGLEALAAELGIAEAVSFLGYKKRHELFQLMCGSESFLFFSRKRSERLPNVVKEAMLAKCLCLVSDTQGIDELIPGEDCGIVFAESDPASIASRALRVLRDEELTARIGEAAHLRVTENFSSNSSMRRYVDVWTAVSSDDRHPDSV